MNTLHDEIASLRAENDFLRAENASLKEVAPDSDILPLKRKFGLTKQEAKLLMKLSDGRPVCKYTLADYVGSKQDAGSNIVVVALCKVRRKIAPLLVTTLHGFGYQLEGENLLAIRGVLRAA